MSVLKFIITGAVSASTFVAGATAVNDTTAIERADSISLGEVTVTASPVVRKVDRDVYVPSETVKAQSDNGLSLLKNVQIPSLFVDNVMETISAGGEDVQLRINGREATIRDVKAIEPSSVVRVEYLDNPGLRYKGATNVVNFVVRNRATGGSVMANTTTTLFGPMFNGFLSTKFNHGKSQWGLDVFQNFMDNTKSEMKTYEQFRLRSQTIDRITDPEEGLSSNQWIYTGLYYNYLVPDKTNIYVNLQLGMMPRNKDHSRGVYSGTGIAGVESTTSSSSRAQYPSLSLYFDQKFAHKQTLVFNTTLGWRRERSYRHYEENEAGQSVADLMIDTRTRVHNFDVSAEVNYIKEWDKVSVTAGANYYQSWSATDYQLPEMFQNKQRQRTLYGFAELTARLNKVTLTGGFGGEYDYMAPGTGKKDNEFIWRPRFSATYRACDVSRFRLTLSSWSVQPSLNELSDVVTDVDGFMQSTGNPNLKSYANFQTRASYMFTKPRVSFELQASIFRAPHAIYDIYYLSDDDKIVSTYANQGRTVWDVSVSPRATLIPDWLTVSGQLCFRRYYMRGPGYRNVASSWSGNFGLSLTHWGFSFDAQGYFAPRRLNGQNYNRSERIHILSLGYKWRDFNFSAGMFCPFGRYSQENGVISPVMTKSTHMVIKSVHCLPFIHLSYNLQWGHQKRQGRRLIDAPDNSSNGSGGIM